MTALAAGEAGSDEIHGAAWLPFLDLNAQAVLSSREGDKVSGSQNEFSMYFHAFLIRHVHADASLRLGG